MTDTIIGASPFEQELYDFISSHVDDEREVLEAYQELAESTESQAFRFVADLILQEERRHHTTMAQLAETVRRSAELSMATPPIPYLDLYKDREAIQAATERLLKVEDQDSRELKQLERKLKDFEHTTLWSLLVKLMQADNDKHRMILEFVRKHAKEQRLSPT